MGSIGRGQLLSLLLAASLVVLAALPARADTVLLANGNIVTGQVDAAQLPVTTSGGTIQVPAADLSHIAFGTIAGPDVLTYKNGTVLAGIIEQPAYSVRLPSGQTVVIERSRVSAIRFRR